MTRRQRLATALVAILALLAPVPAGIDLATPAAGVVIVPPVRTCATKAEARKIRKGATKEKVTRLMHQQGLIVAHRVHNNRLTMTVRYERCNRRLVYVWYREGRTLADGRVVMVVKRVAR